MTRPTGVSSWCSVVEVYLRVRFDEDLADPGNIDEKQNHERRDGKGEKRHKPWLAIEFFRILHGAFVSEGKSEVDGHEQCDHWKGENEFHAIAHDESAEEQHGCHGIEDD